MGIFVLIFLIFGAIAFFGVKLFNAFLNSFNFNENQVSITSVTDKDNVNATLSTDQTVIVKEPSFSPSNINSYIQETEQKKFIYRPKTLSEYIGQDKAKELINLNLRKVKTLKLVHFLISGHRGCGKTTLAHIIKNSLNAKMIERIAGEITNPDQIIDLVNEINASKEKFVILFIDEIHALKPSLCESLYPIMEDFKIAGKIVKPFIMIGATTEKNILLKKVAPLVDRFQVQIELEQYTNKDVETILRQYKDQLYSDYKVGESYYTIISENCKNTPRIAISLLEDTLIENNISKVLSCHRILKDGLTDTDIKILRILSENKKQIGAGALAQMVGISQNDFVSVYEPYLMSKEYITRTARGRQIAVRGESILTEMSR